MRLDSLPNIREISIAAEPVTNQPKKLTEPNGARTEGNKNTPEPIITPTEMDQHFQKPIFFLFA